MLEKAPVSVDQARRIYRALTLYYLDGLKQAEIATRMHQSVATVNRLIRQGRELGMVEIALRSPFQSAFELERELAVAGGLSEALVAPAVSVNDEQTLKSVASAAAALLLSRIKDGDVICITGGKGMSALVEALQPERAYDVAVVPALGCVQGKHYTDVNHVSYKLAAKLGGRSYQIHAPMFADSVAQRGVVMSMRAVNEVLDMARGASIAIVGLGSILAEESSYFDLNPLARQDRDAIARSGARSELLAHLLDAEGRIVDYGANACVVGLTPAELARIPFSFAVVAGSHKVEPVCSVLRGRHLNGLVTDETTASAVLARLAGPPEDNDLP